MFTPTLHIFIGQDHHFFTLRESYLHEQWYNTSAGPKCNREVRYSHLFNLSQDYQEALAKAKEASKNFGLQLVASEDREEQLREIHRRTQEEIEQERERLRVQNEELQAKYEADRRKQWARWKIEAKCELEGLINVTRDRIELVEMLLETGKIDSDNYLDAIEYFRSNPVFIKSEYPGRMIGGAFHGTSLNNVTLSYMQWLVYTSGLCEIDAEETMHKMAFVAQWIRDNRDVPAPIAALDEHLGEVGEKVEVEVSIDRMVTKDGMYGTTYIYSMTSKQGHKLVWFASHRKLQGVNVKIKGTIKRLGEFQGGKQTVLTRVSEVA